MFNLRGESVCKPLDAICKTCLKSVKFPLESEKAEVVPVHKKGKNRLLKIVPHFLCSQSA